MPALIYDAAIYDLATGGIDFAADHFAVMLVGPGYVPDKANHARRSDVSGEIAGKGYEAGGRDAAVAAIRSVGMTEVTLGGAVWARATFVARGAVYYKARGGSAELDELVAYVGADEDVTATNGDFTLSASLIELSEESPAA